MSKVDTGLANYRIGRLLGFETENDLFKEKLAQNI